MEVAGIGHYNNRFSKWGTVATERCRDHIITDAATTESPISNGFGGGTYICNKWFLG